MQVSEHITFGLFSLIILFLVYFNTKQPQVRKLPQDAVFGHIVTSCIVIVALDILCVLINGQTGSFLRVLNYGLVVLTRTIDILPSLLWVVYVCYHVFQDVHAVRRIKKLLIAGFMINAVLVVSSVFTGWVFEIDAANRFVHGPLSYIRSVYALSFLFFGTAVAVAGRKKLEKSLFLGLLYFMLPVSIGIISQWFVKSTAFVGCGISISVLTVYINIQNKHVTTDYLTGVYNRRQLDHYTAQKIRRHAKRPFGAILIDLDGFKAINDLYGHHTGDRMLQTAARLIGDCVGKEDFIARYGGDEFCVVMDMDTPLRLQQVAKNIQDRTKAYNQDSEKSMRINMSMGYDVYDESLAKNAQAFLEHIDRLMYKNKKSK